MEQATLSKEMLFELRRSGVLLENEIAFYEGDLCVAKNVITGEKRLLNVEKTLLESRKTLLKG